MCSFSLVFHDKRSLKIFSASVVARDVIGCFIRDGVLIVIRMVPMLLL